MTLINFFLSFSFFKPIVGSLAGALHGQSGGPEGHERQRSRLQVHYPGFCGGLRCRRIMGEGHSFPQLR